MTGHVFHPGHSELHGITVVLETDGDATYIGRYHEETPKGILLHDVAEHDDRATRADFVARTLKFGVRATHRHLTVPTSKVERLVRLVEWKG
jgi:hypothetical protein